MPALFLVVASALSVLALFPSFSSGSPSLASNPSNLWYNMPFIAAWVTCAVLLVVPTTRLVGAGLAIGATTCAIPAYLTSVGDFIGGKYTLGDLLNVSTVAGAGELLGLIAIIFALVAAVVLFVSVLRGGLRPSARSLGAMWAVLAALCGLIFAIGYALPFSEQHVHLTVAGWTFPTTGSPDVFIRCCSIVQVHGRWNVARGWSLIFLAVLVPALAAAAVPVKVGIGAILGTALILSAESLAGIVNLQQGPPSLAQLGIRTGGAPVVTQHGLIGLWLALIGAVLLAIVALARGISAATT